MTKDAIAQAMSGQFRRTLKMFREAALAFPLEEWREGDIDYLRPAGLAYHVVETIDFYTGDQSVHDFPWSARLGVDWEDSRSELLPSQEQLMVYLDEMQRKLEAWLTETDLMAPEPLFPWAGVSMLERAVHLLRHSQHHLGELCLELTRRGYPGPDWQ
jgi:hypothetical protein